MEKYKVTMGRQLKRKIDVKKTSKSKKKIKLDKKTTPPHILSIDLTEDSESEVSMKIMKEQKLTTLLRKGTPITEKENDIFSELTKKSNDKDIIASKIIKHSKWNTENDDIIIISSSSSSQDNTDIMWEPRKEKEKIKPIKLILTSMEDEMVTSEEGDVEKIRLSEILRNTKVEEQITTSGLSESTNEDEEVNNSSFFVQIEKRTASNPTCTTKRKKGRSVKRSKIKYDLPGEDTININYKKYKKIKLQSNRNQNFCDNKYVLHLSPNNSSGISKGTEHERVGENWTYSTIKAQEKQKMSKNKNEKILKPSCEIEVADEEHEKKEIVIDGIVRQTKIHEKIAQNNFGNKATLNEESLVDGKKTKGVENPYERLFVSDANTDTSVSHTSSDICPTGTTVLTKLDYPDENSSWFDVERSKNNITDVDKDRPSIKYGSEDYQHGELLHKEEQIIQNLVSEMTDEEDEEVKLIYKDKNNVAEVGKSGHKGITGTVDYEETQNEKIGYKDETLLGFTNVEQVNPQMEELLLPSKVNKKMTVLDTSSGVFIETNWEDIPESSELIKKKNLKVHMNLFKKENIKAKILKMFPNLKKFCSSSYNMKVTFNIKANLNRQPTKQFWRRCTCKISRLYNLKTIKSRSLVGLVFYVKCRKHGIFQPLCTFKRAVHPEE